MAKQRGWFQLSCVHDVSPATAMPQVIRRLKATQPPQPATRWLQLFCVRGVLPVKAMQRALRSGRAIALGPGKYWQGRLQK